MRNDLPPTLTIPEAAALLRLGKNTVYAACNNGQLPVLRFGRRMLIPRDALMQFLARQGEEPRRQS